jgi:hypothetical protein
MVGHGDLGGGVEQGEWLVPRALKEGLVLTQNLSCFSLYAVPREFNDIALADIRGIGRDTPQQSKEIPVELMFGAIGALSQILLVKVLTGEILVSLPHHRLHEGGGGNEGEIRHQTTPSSSRDSPSGGSRYLP